MARDTQHPRTVVDSLKHYSIGLLLAGMGLIAGSCVPLGQALHAVAGPEPESWSVSPDGDATVLDLAEALRVAPLVLVEPLSDGALEYVFSITAPDGTVILRETGETSPARSVAGLEAERGPRLAFRFPEVDLAAGHWTVRFEARPATAVAGAAELRLVAASPGLVPSLTTALMLAILGWLAASLGALQWIRAEAGRPAAAGTGGGERERVWAVGCHLSALLGYVLPFGHLIGPSAIWLSKRRALPGLERTGRDVLNFQLSATVYVLAGLFLSFFLIGVAVLFVVVVFHFATVLRASLRAQRGAPVKYPLAMRFI